MPLVVLSEEIWNRAIYEWSLKDFTNIIWLLTCADATFPEMSVRPFLRSNDLLKTGHKICQMLSFAMKPK
jgi:hypothetical protein